MTTRKHTARNRPAKSLNKVTFQHAAGPRRVLGKIRTTLRQTRYRKDLKTIALRRASALLQAQRPKVAKAEKNQLPKKSNKLTKISRFYLTF